MLTDVLCLLLVFSSLFHQLQADSLCECLHDTEQPLEPCLHMQAFTRNSSHFIIVQSDNLFQVDQQNCELEPTPMIYLYDRANQSNLIASEKWHKVSWLSEPLHQFGVDVSPSSPELTYLAMYSNVPVKVNYSTVPMTVNDVRFSNGVTLHYTENTQVGPYTTIPPSLPPKPDLKFATVVSENGTTNGYLIEMNERVLFYDLGKLFITGDKFDAYSLIKLGGEKIKFVKEPKPDQPNLLTKVPFGVIVKDSVLLFDLSTEQLFHFPYVTLPGNGDAQPFHYRKSRIRDFFECSAKEGHWPKNSTLLIIGTILLVVISLAMVGIVYRRSKRNLLSKAIENAGESTSSVVSDTKSRIYSYSSSKYVLHSSNISSPRGQDEAP